MISRLLPHLFYLAGSLCFVIGTSIVIWRMVRGG